VRRAGGRHPLLEREGLRGRLDLLVDLELPAALAQAIERLLS
jgi:hypothetical protein